MKSDEGLNKMIEHLRAGLLGCNVPESDVNSCMHEFRAYMEEEIEVGLIGVRIKAEEE